MVRAYLKRHGLGFALRVLRHRGPAEKLRKMLCLARWLALMSAILSRVRVLFATSCALYQVADWGDILCLHFCLGFPSFVTLHLFILDLSLIDYLGALIAGLNFSGHYLNNF